MMNRLNLGFIDQRTKTQPNLHNTRMNFICSCTQTCLSFCLPQLMFELMMNGQKTVSQISSKTSSFVF